VSQRGKLAEFKRAYELRSSRAIKPVVLNEPELAPF